MRNVTLLLAFFLGTVFSLASQSAAAKTPDVLIFSNGDQLSGKILRAVSGSVVFKSDMAGELTIPFDKIKELRSGTASTQFAMLPKNVPAKKQQAFASEGVLSYSDGTITLTPEQAAPIAMKPADVAYLIDKPTYEKSIARRAGPLDGWNGAITGGATIVRSSQIGDTYTAGVSLVRAIPTVPYLPARNRTLINATESYGKLTTVEPPPPPDTVETTVKTSIFHGEIERDEYFTPRLYALAEASFDHNFSQLLQLQQIYGGGVGWTAVKHPKQQLDLKVDAHYEAQEFFAPEPPAAPSVAAPSISLFGSTFGETYTRTFPRKVVFTESGTYIPAWTTLSAYSANLSGALAMPVFKRLSVSVSTTDGYLNNAPVGSRRNSFQFVTGVTYSIR